MLRRESTTPAITIVKSMNASGLAASVRIAPAAKRPRRPCCNAQIESSANDIASANGNAAAPMMPTHRTANDRLETRESDPHCRYMTMLKIVAADAIDASASTLIPNSAASG